MGGGKVKWRKRMGIEPTPRAAKARGNGFEDRESHQAPGASERESSTGRPAARRGAPGRPDPAGALARSVPVRLALLALLLAVAYAGALRAGVAWDDIYLISGNPAIRSLDQPWRFFTDPRTMIPTGGPLLAQYRPLRTLLFAVEFAAFGGSAWGYHLVSIALFALTAWLVGRLAAAAFGGGAWLAAAVWLLHPALAENVVSLSAQSNLLCLAFSLAAVVAHLRWNETGDLRLRAASLVALAGAVLSYEVGATVPLLIVIAELAIGRAVWRPPAQAVRRHLPLWLTLAGVLAVRAAVVMPMAAPQWWGGSRLASLAVQLRVWVEGLRLSVLPLGQHPRYLPADLPAFATLGVAVAVHVALAAVVVRALATGRGRVPAACIAWWYAAQAPMCNFIVPTIGYVFAARFLFLALALPVAALAAWLAARLAPRTLAVALAAASVAAVPLVRDVVDTWQTPISLNRSIIGANPGDSAAHALLGWSYVLYGDDASARPELEAALRLAPGSTAATFLLAEVEMRQGEMREAHRAFAGLIERRAMAVEPALRLAEIAIAVRQRQAALDWLATLGPLDALEPYPRARAELTAARLELLLGRRDDVPARVDRALSAWSDTADVLFDGGVLLSYAGDRARGRELLRRAADQAGRDFATMVGGERRGDLSMLRPLIPLTPPARFASFSVPMVGP